MSKVCFNCGAELADNAVSCEKCNTQISAPAPSAPIAPAAPSAPVAPAAPSAPAAPATDKKAGGSIIDKIKKNPAIAFIPVAVIFVIVIASLVIPALFNSGYNKAIDNMLDVLAGKANQKTLEACAPEAIWDYLEEEEGMTVDELYDAYEEELKDEDLERKLARFSYKVLDEEECTGEELEELAEYLDDCYDIRESSVEEAYVLEVELTAKLIDETDTMQLEIEVVKIDGEWYCTELMESLGYGSVYF